MLSAAKHLPVKISFLAAPFMTTRPERRVTFLGCTTLAFQRKFAHGRGEFNRSQRCRSEFSDYHSGSGIAE
jgi:hypothetical protein